MILPASEAEGLVEIIVLARSRFYVRVDLNPNDINVPVVGYGGNTTMEGLFAQSNVEIAVNYPKDPQETVEAPDSNEGP